MEPHAGSATTSTVSVNPGATDTYTVTGDDSGCTVTNTITVNVTATPTLNISGTTAICSGDSTTLTGSGAISYTWSANATSATTSTVSVNPGSTDTYTLTGEDNGCTDIKTITVNVTATPTVNITGITTICSGDSTTLTASGAASYTWSANAGSATTSTVTVKPSSSDTYTITGENAGCSGMQAVNITINTLPSVTFDMIPNLYCTTDPSITLSATPASGLFYGTAVTAGTFDPNTAGPGTYTLSYLYTDGNTCSNTDTAVVSVQICMGINQLGTNAISIYPNPATDLIIIQSSSLSENSVLEIYSSLGQKVSSILLNTNTTHVSISGLNAGIYEARVISNNVIIRQVKIIKQ